MAIAGAIAAEMIETIKTGAIPLEIAQRTGVGEAAVIIAPGKTIARPGQRTTVAGAPRLVHPHALRGRELY